MKLFKQSVTIIITFLFIFTVVNTQLSSYIPYILALIIAFSIIFMVLKNRKNKARGKHEELFIGSNLEVFTITAGLLLMVFLTGDIQSNLFFLLYFLLFGIAFLFEPASVFIFSLCLIGIFILPMFQDDVFGNAIKVGSLVCLSPIAFFFSREFKRREKLEREVKKKTDKILDDVKKLEEQEGEFDEIEDIAKEAQSLKKKIQE